MVLTAESGGDNVVELNPPFTPAQEAYNSYAQRLSPDQRITMDELIPFISNEFSNAGFDSLLGDDIVVQNAYLMSKYGDKYSYDSMMENAQNMFTSFAKRGESVKISTSEFEATILEQDEIAA